MYYVEVNRGDGWHLVGQYKSKRIAYSIARNYQSQGIPARVTND